MMAGKFLSDWNASTLSIDELDLDFVINISRQIPASGEINAAIAASLALKFLSAANTCSELIAQITRIVGYRETGAKREGSLAATTRSNETSAKGKELYRDSDQLYVDARNQLTEAEALLTLLNNKYSILMAAHYMCKEIVRNEKVGDYNSNANSKLNGIDKGFAPEKF